MHPEALNSEGQKVFPVLKNFKPFYLAGGTAIALQLGHRLSVDFDLFSQRELPDSLLATVEKIFSGHKVVAQVNNKDELTVFVDEIKITFLHYPFPVLGDFVEYEGLNILTLPELAATKAYTIGRRGSFKDYIDLYFAIISQSVALPRVIGLAEEKYSNSFNSRLFLEQLIYLEDIADTNIIFLKESVDKKQLEEFFTQEIGKIKI